MTHEELSTVTNSVGMDFAHFDLHKFDSELDFSNKIGYVHTIATCHFYNALCIYYTAPNFFVMTHMMLNHSWWLYSATPAIWTPTLLHVPDIGSVMKLYKQRLRTKFVVTTISISLIFCLWFACHNKKSSHSSWAFKGTPGSLCTLMTYDLLLRLQWYLNRHWMHLLVNFSLGD